MPQENSEVVRSLWAALDRDPGTPWPPPPEELDRRIRADLCDEQIEIRNPPEFPVADEYHGHEGLRRWATEVWEVLKDGKALKAHGYRTRAQALEAAGVRD